jgi:hypothetical protein
MSAIVPVIKVSEAKFLIGCELKQLEIKHQQVMVRIGGGYEELSEYLHKSGKVQCLKLYTMKKEQNLTLGALISTLLVKHGASEKTCADIGKAFTSQ